MSPAEAPATIGRYKIENELGRGTMGVVYRAFDPVLGRAIALKTILLDHLASEKREAFEQRFLSEARIAAQLSHPGIVVVHDIGRDAPTGLLFIALELLEGETLSHMLAAHRLPSWRDGLRIVARVASALNHAHARGVVHRDIKPANIMILASGQPKIMDFGIAKIEQSSTVSAELVGTPLYMSPEQATGQSVDARSDLFALGSIAYALLTGKPPFRADTVHAILARVTYQQPPLPSEGVSGLPPEVDYVIQRAMAKQPEERYASGEAMAEDIEDILAGLPPRNRQGWSAPERGDMTIASAHLDRRQLDELALEPVEETVALPPKPRPEAPQRSVSLPLFFLLLALAALYVQLDPNVMQFWSDAAESLRPALARSGTTPTPAATVAVPVVGPIAATPAPAPSVEPSASPTVEAEEQEEPAVDEPDETASAVSAPAATPERESTPTPIPGTQHAGVATPHPPPPRPDPARLTIEFQHSLKNGTLRVWVDGKPMLTERLSSKVTRKILIFQTRKGYIAKALTLTPGRHEIRVTVQSGKVHQGGRLRSTFHPGAAKRLAVVYDDGRLAFYWRKTRS